MSRIDDDRTGFDDVDVELESAAEVAYFLSLMASALAHAAEPENAASVGHEALIVAVETHSLRTIHELKRVCALLTPWCSQPVVRALRDAVLPL